MISDDELLAQAIRGDDAALAELLERVGLAIQSDLEPKIGAQYRGLVDAEDIMQITCLEAFLRIRNFVRGGPGSFTGWLRRIADNNLRDAIRELERDKRPSPGKRVTAAVGDESYIALVERVAATTSTASRVVSRDEVKQALTIALSQLPPDYEQAVRLYELEGLSGPEVADRMQRSHGAVRMLLARARERLAEVIGSESRFFSTGG